MKLSTKARYGLRAVYFLGKSSPEVVSLAVLSKDIGVSSGYIEQLMRLLKQDGIVESVRGVSGGYVLARTPDKITLGEILRSLEDGLELVDCISGTKCSAHCPTRDVWVKIYDAINETLDKITLKQMLEDNKANDEKDIFGLCGNNIRQE